MSFSPTMDFARDLFDRFEGHWQLEPRGIYCPGYSTEENEAINMVATKAQAMGMERHIDVAGNNYFVMRGENRTAPVFMTGSHVDAVPEGGRYDGRAGVVAGMAAAHYLHEHNIVPPQDYVVVVWRNEESAWFRKDCVGSRLAVGGQGLSADFLDNAKHRTSAERIATHMDAVGVNACVLSQALAQGEALFPIDQVGAYVEQHIEQERDLLEQKISVGIVTAIRGNMRTPETVRFLGKADHSGACPMKRREDAARALFHTATEFDQTIDGLALLGADAVWTVPELGTPGASSTTVCKEAYGRFEVRSTDESVLNAAKEMLIRTAKAKAKKYKAELILDPEAIAISPPALMDERVQNLLEQAAQAHNISYQRMPSGAGHDAGILAKAGVPASVLFTRHAGRSHLADELLGKTPEDNPFAVDSDFAHSIKIIAEAAQQTVFDPRLARSNQTFAEQLKI